jgi:hypothetical protein
MLSAPEKTVAASIVYLLNELGCKPWFDFVWFDF